MDSKVQYFVHFDIFTCRKLDLTSYYYLVFLFDAEGTLFASKALVKINTFLIFYGKKFDYIEFLSVKRDSSHREYDVLIREKLMTHKEQTGEV